MNFKTRMILTLLLGYREFYTVVLFADYLVSVAAVSSRVLEGIFSQSLRSTSNRLIRSVLSIKLYCV